MLRSIIQGFAIERNVVKVLKEQSPESIDEKYAEFIESKRLFDPTSGWQTSSGALREVEKAKKQGIPIFESLEALQKWSSKQKENL
jgi:hypothetical protein